MRSNYFATSFSRWVTRNNRMPLITGAPTENAPMSWWPRDLKNSEPCVDICCILCRSGAICKTIWQPSNKLWPSEIYVWVAETNPRIPYTCQLTYRMITHHIRKTEILQWALHKTRSWGRYSYHKLSLFNKCCPMSDDISVCVSSLRKVCTASPKYPGALTVIGHP